MKNGLVCVFVPGSSGDLTTIEYKPGLMKNLPKVLERIAPKKSIKIIMKHGMMIMAINTLSACREHFLTKLLFAN